MRVQGPNPLINIYQNNQSKTVNKSKETRQTDKLDISFTAMKLQENNTNNLERSNKVAQIKEQVQSDEYKINYEETANKLIQFLIK